ncbi:translation elongation factor Ts [Candidatus Peregrinibacteria bacterium]|nr:MAG: translation elongation factor Ts [Candidatus Peregrinibacteria bacterium]
MSVSIDQIKSLRERTGVSMSACKSALEEANGDEEMAIEILRKKGAAKAAERADRATANGVVSIVQQDNKAAMIALGCETDFVAKNPDFLKRAQELAEKLLREGEDANFDQDISELGMAMGEKVVISDKKVVSGPKLAAYTHLNNRIGVIVSASGGDEETVRDIAMHVAAMNPKNLSPEDISSELVAKEKEIWTEQLKAEGKPDAIIEKIMEGKEKKFREEFALLTQAFVKNPEKLIKDLLSGEKIEGFWRFEV